MLKLDRPLRRSGAHAKSLILLPFAIQADESLNPNPHPHHHQVLHDLTEGRPDGRRLSPAIWRLAVADSLDDELKLVKQVHR